MASTTKWLPLESNPDVMNKFLVNLGVPADWSIVDVIGLDEELLQMVPKPVLAILLLFPINEKHEEFAKKQDRERECKNTGVYFMKQTIKNACGTVALIHAVANGRAGIDLVEGSPLRKFLESTADLSAIERGEALEKDEAIGAAHEESAKEGETEAPTADEDINLHFVSFVHVDGRLYELDGRRAMPIDHGSTTEDTLLEDAGKVCKEVMSRNPDSLHFTVVALAATQQHP